VNLKEGRGSVSTAYRNRTASNRLLKKLKKHNLLTLKKLKKHIVLTLKKLKKHTLLTLKKLIVLTLMKLKKHTVLTRLFSDVELHFKYNWN